MKLYYVSSTIPPTKPGWLRALRPCIEPIAKLIASHLAADPALFGIRHAGEISDAPLPATDRYGYAEVVRIESEESLLRVLLACGDPDSGQWMLIRSLVTCRAVLYGYDGQAYVCLPTEAPPIVSPDERFIAVEDCSHLLIDNDLMDGLRDHDFMDDGLPDD
jgi:hypothetical protein